MFLRRYRLLTYVIKNENLIKNENSLILFN